jgi:hypothetical protein
MPTKPFETLLLAIRPLRRFSLRDSENQRSQSISLTQAEVNLLAEYLEAPTQNGYWRLTGRWNFGGKLSQYLYEKLAPKFFIEKEENAPRAATLLAGYGLTDEQEQLVRELFGRISTVFELFALGAHRDPSSNASPAKSAKSGDWISEIDISDLPQKFSDALSIFKAKLFFDEFRTKVTDEPFRIASGVFFVLRGPREAEQIIAASMTDTCLRDLASFLTATGQLVNASIDRVFSPEEELFQPYFVSLSAAFSQVINDDRVKPQFRQAFDYYQKSDFVHCVSTLGLLIPA